MFNLHKDSFDLMRQDLTHGSLEKSKLLNCLVWNPDVCRGSVPMVHQPFQQEDSMRWYKSTYSILDNLDKHVVWNQLSVPIVEEDGCEYCTMLGIDKEKKCKHLIYTDGILTCPNLRDPKPEKQSDESPTRPCKKAGKKRVSKGAKRNE
ncbi:uncharacterized protein LOC125766512 [Anopheles funestus]|uniref:uncharacterized protein LOC125766512 n=1 Tax=Anopheles funestus TaxID=62324 RepID=UPI0020C73814|nr:uncharacterized protein LOC125766512 [Anopheles funestus]